MMTSDEKTRESAEGNGRGSRGGRSTGFPVMPLPKAVDILRTGGRQRTVHTRQAFAGYMGHATVNSGSFLRRLAAMKDWGLITTTGDQVVFTELGRAIAFPISSEAEHLEIQSAFRHAAPFARMLELLPHCQPIQLDIVANSAAANLGVAPASRGKFAESFEESAVFAGLARKAGPGAIELIDDADGEQVDPTDTAGGDHEEEPPTTQGAERSDRTGSGLRAVISPVWPVSGGEVVFEVRLDRPLPARAWAQVGAITGAIEELITILESDAQAPDRGERP